MKYVTILVSAGCMTLAGCSTLATPGPNSNQEKIVADPLLVVSQTWCELSRSFAAYPDQALTLAEYSVTANISLKGTETIASSPGLKISQTSPNKATIPTGFGVSDTGTLSQGFKLVSTVKEIVAAGQRQDLCASPTIAASGRGLYLEEWLNSTLEAYKGPVRTALGGTTYSAVFDASRTLSGGITFETSVVSLTVDKQSAVSGRTNQLDITLLPPQPPEEKDKAKTKGKGNGGAKAATNLQYLTTPESAQNVKKLRNDLLNLPDGVFVLQDGTELKVVE